MRPEPARPHTTEQRGKPQAGRKRQQQIGLDEEARKYCQIEGMPGRQIGQSSEHEGVAEEDAKNCAQGGALLAVARRPQQANRSEQRADEEQTAQSAPQHLIQRGEKRARLEEHAGRGRGMSHAECAVVATEKMRKQTADRALISPRQGGPR